MILFITRKYPPSVGGMETLSYNVTTRIARRVPAQIVKCSGARKHLLWFVFYALVRSFIILLKHPIDLIHIGDWALAPLGMFLRCISGRPVIISAHGLDVIYPNWLYQAIVTPCAKRLDFVICISEHTRQQCLVRGVKAEHTAIIPLGVDHEAFQVVLAQSERDYWISKWGVAPHLQRFLLTVGRLVPRKGLYFFVSQVLPLLNRRRRDWVYLIIGDGPECRLIQAAIEAKGLQGQVRMLGQVPSQELKAAYAIADLFIMPNIPVKGDSEGFGLVTLEARAAGLLVIASCLEGISESFGSEEDGVLVPPGDAERFAEAIDLSLNSDLTLEARLRRRHRIIEHWGWEQVIDKYLQVFEMVRGDAGDESRC